MKEQPQLWPIWVGMLLAQPIIVTVLLTQAPAEAGDPTVQMVGLMAIPELVFAGPLFPFVFKGAPAQNAFIIRWAMVVSAAIFGGVSGFLGAPAVFPALLVIVCMATMVWLRPTADAYTAWEMRRLTEND